MATYVYKVRDTKGKQLKGSVEAVSERAAADRLTASGLLVTTIKPKQNLSLWTNLDITASKISADDLTMFYLQLGNMLDAGLPLLTALRSMQGQIDNRSLKKSVSEITRRIEGGESLSEGMSRFPKIFPPLYRNLIQVGETSGNLGYVLANIAELNESKEELNHQIRSALAYPIILILASVAVVVFMMMWLIPAFIVIFDRSNIPLPTPTRVLYALSLFLKSNWPVVSGLIVILFVGGKLLLRLHFVKYRWDQFWLSVPVIGLLTKRIEISRWARNIALMLRSGVPLLKALQISKSLTGNAVFEETLRLAPDSVEAGGKLAEAIQKNGVFPNDVIQMVATGESSGSLDKMLHKVSEFYDQLVTRSLKKLTSMIEPTFILLMGVVVGFIMLSIFLPIFDMIKIFKPS